MDKKNKIDDSFLDEVSGGIGGDKNSSLFEYSKSLKIKPPKHILMDYGVPLMKYGVPLPKGKAQTIKNPESSLAPSTTDTEVKEKEDKK